VHHRRETYNGGTRRASRKGEKEKGLIRFLVSRGSKVADGFTNKKGGGKKREAGTVVTSSNAKKNGRVGGLGGGGGGSLNHPSEKSWRDQCKGTLVRKRGGQTKEGGKPPVLEIA